MVDGIEAKHDIIVWRGCECFERLVMKRNVGIHTTVKMGEGLFVGIQQGVNCCDIMLRKYNEYAGRAAACIQYALFRVKLKAGGYTLDNPVPVQFFVVQVCTYFFIGKIPFPPEGLEKLREPPAPGLYHLAIKSEDAAENTISFIKSER